MGKASVRKSNTKKYIGLYFHTFLDCTTLGLLKALHKINNQCLKIQYLFIHGGTTLNFPELHILHPILYSYFTFFSFLFFFTLKYNLEH